MRCLAAAGSLIALLAAAGGLRSHGPFPDAPPPAHTGGFGEPTCLQCHFDGALNAPGGALRVEGLPEQYAPGETYAVAVRVAHAGMQRGGFQMSARYAEGEHEGRQAGHFSSTEAEVKAGVSVDLAEGIEYVRQRAAEPAPDSVLWRFGWTAPDTAAGPVAFHVAANAANGDASAFGDYVYTWEAVSHGP